MFRSENSVSRTRILFVCRYDIVFFPPMQNLIELTSNEHAQVTLVSNHTVTIKRFDMNLPEGVHQISLPIGNSAIRRVINSLRFSLVAIWQILFGNYSHLFVSGTSVYAILLAAITRGITKRAFVEYDRSIPRRSLARLMDPILLGRLLNRGFAVIAPNDMRLNLLEQYCGYKLNKVALPNFPREYEFVHSPSKRAFDGRLKLYFHGTFVENRVPLNLIEVLVRLQNVEFHIVPILPDYVGGDRYFKEFCQHAEHAGVSSRLYFHDCREPAKLPALACRYDLGVAIFDDHKDVEKNMSSMWGASNKVTQYLAYGLVPLVATSEKEMIQNLNAFAYFCDVTKIDDTVQLLNRVVSQWDDFQERRLAGYNHAKQTWTFERAFQSVKNLLI